MPRKKSGHGTSCAACKRAKRKCDGGRPCARCVSMGIEMDCVDTLESVKWRARRELGTGKRIRDRTKRKELNSAVNAVVSSMAPVLPRDVDDSVVEEGSDLPGLSLLAAAAADNKEDGADIAEDLVKEEDVDVFSGVGARPRLDSVEQWRGADGLGGLGFDLDAVGGVGVVGEDGNKILDDGNSVSSLLMPGNVGLMSLWEDASEGIGGAVSPSAVLPSGSGNAWESAFAGLVAWDDGNLSPIADDSAQRSNASSSIASIDSNLERVILAGVAPHSGHTPLSVAWDSAVRSHSVVDLESRMRSAVEAVYTRAAYKAKRVPPSLKIGELYPSAPVMYAACLSVAARRALRYRTGTEVDVAISEVMHRVLEEPNTSSSYLHPVLEEFLHSDDVSMSLNRAVRSGQIGASGVSLEQRRAILELASRMREHRGMRRMTCALADVEISEGLVLGRPRGTCGVTCVTMMDIITSATYKLIRAGLPDHMLLPSEPDKIVTQIQSALADAEEEEEEEEEEEVVGRDERIRKVLIQERTTATMDVIVETALADLSTPAVRITYDPEHGLPLSLFANGPAQALLGLCTHALRRALAHDDELDYSHPAAMLPRHRAALRAMLERRSSYAFRGRLLHRTVAEWREQQFGYEGEKGEFVVLAVQELGQPVHVLQTASGDYSQHTTRSKSSVPPSLSRPKKSTTSTSSSSSFPPPPQNTSSSIFPPPPQNTSSSEECAHAQKGLDSDSESDNEEEAPRSKSTREHHYASSTIRVTEETLRSPVASLPSDATPISSRPLPPGQPLLTRVVACVGRRFRIFDATEHVSIAWYTKRPPAKDPLPTMLESHLCLPDVISWPNTDTTGESGPFSGGGGGGGGATGAATASKYSATDTMFSGGGATGAATASKLSDAATASKFSDAAPTSKFSKSSSGSLFGAAKMAAEASAVYGVGSKSPSNDVDGAPFSGGVSQKASSPIPSTSSKSTSKRKKSRSSSKKSSPPSPTLIYAPFEHPNQASPPYLSTPKTRAADPLQPGPPLPAFDPMPIERASPSKRSQGAAILVPPRARSATIHFRDISWRGWLSTAEQCLIGMTTRRVAHAHLFNPAAVPEASFVYQSAGLDPELAPAALHPTVMKEVQKWFQVLSAAAPKERHILIQKHLRALQQTSQRFTQDQSTGGIFSGGGPTASKDGIFSGGGGPTASKDGIFSGGSPTASKDGIFSGGGGPTTSKDTSSSSSAAAAATTSKDTSSSSAAAATTSKDTSSSSAIPPTTSKYTSSSSAAAATTSKDIPPTTSNDTSNERPASMLNMLPLPSNPVFFALAPSDLRDVATKHPFAFILPATCIGRLPPHIVMPAVLVRALLRPNHATRKGPVVSPVEAIIAKRGMLHALSRRAEVDPERHSMHDASKAITERQPPNSPPKSPPKSPSAGTKRTRPQQDSLPPSASPPEHKKTKQEPQTTFVVPPILYALHQQLANARQ